MPPTDLTDLFEKAHFIRAFEHGMALEADAGRVPGLLHLCLGAELFETALCAHLSGPTDQVTGSHRSHGLALGMGADPVAVAAEILGLSGGLSGGLGGTQHLMAPEVGFLASNGIVGAQVPMAAGAALSAKTLKTGGIGVAVMGDGATNQGAVFETLNLAMALRLPMLFVIENNGLGQSTAAAYATGGISPMARARGFGLATHGLDGGDIMACMTLLGRLIPWIREAGLPALIEVSVPRLGGHYHGDKQTYRPVADSIRDPLQRFEEQLLRAGVTDADLAALKAHAQHRAAEALVAAGAMQDTSTALMHRLMSGLAGGVA